MQRQYKNEFDHATLEAMMERYRAELLRYQRATPPGKPTLAESFKEVAAEEPVAHREEKPKVLVQPEKAIETKAVIIPSPAQKQQAVVKTQEIKPVKNTMPVSPQKQMQIISVKEDTPVTPLLNRPEIVQEVKSTFEGEQVIAEKIPELTVQVEIPLVETVQTVDNPVEVAVAESNIPTGLEDDGNSPVYNREENIEIYHPVDSFGEENGTYTSMAPEIVVPQPTFNQEPDGLLMPPAISQGAERCVGHREFEKGMGAYGTFRPYERMGQYTTASFLQTPGEATPVLVRFSTDVPIGSSDAIRARRSFSVKFFCREGEYDLFGMHLPVSVSAADSTLDACSAAFRASPRTGVRSRNAFWEFLVTHTEALHATLWLYSDLGTIGSYRTIDGYGLPCLWTNSKGEQHVVRTRWLSRQRPQTLTRFEAEELAGSDPDAVARDLVEAITAGEYPQFELAVQTIALDQIAALPFDPFDPTAIWPSEQFKLQKIGLMALDRLPEDVASELSSMRFDPKHVISGIAFPPSPAIKKGDDFTQARQYLRSLGEFSRHRLVDNLTEELMRLPPLLLEQVLILFSRADLEFGQAVTLALGG